MKPIDIIVPYVNGLDPNWMRLACKYCGVIPYNRVRDLGTLRYFFRGVETNMDWIRYVWLVVQSPSQIPAWLNVNHPKLRIVYHADYIPKKYLPTFNSNVIELYYHKIRGLSSQFILANDDMAAIRPLTPDMFFDGNSIVYGPVTRKENWYPYTDHYICNGYSHILYNSAVAAGKITGKCNRPYYPQYHLFMPHLKTCYKLGWSRYGSGIKGSFKYHRDRHADNICHLVFYYVASELGLVKYDYNYHNGFIRVHDGAQYPMLIDALDREHSTVCCFNDDFRYTTTNVASYTISNTLEHYLPQHSLYEL